MLFNLPIEDLPERYSYLWNRTVPQQLRELNVKVHDIRGGGFTAPDRIRNGQFLDVAETLKYKAGQMRYMAEMAGEGSLKDGDVVFVHDLWFPGLEALFYLRDALGIKFKIAGMLHAGTYDPYDYLTQRNMARWAHSLENTWFHEVDAIFVATEFHKEMLCTARSTRGQVYVTGFPAAWPVGTHGLEEQGRISNKRKLVVFPHRLAPEKCPEMFDEVAARLAPDYPEWEFLATKKVWTTKADYYRLLCNATIAVSCAQQETWGIAMQEAVIAGCVPVVPAALSYDEMYGDHFKYAQGDMDELEQVLRHFLSTTWKPNAAVGYLAQELETLKGQINTSAAMAVHNMVRVMRQQGWNV